MNNGQTVLPFQYPTAEATNTSQMMPSFITIPPSSVTMPPIMPINTQPSSDIMPSMLPTNMNMMPDKNSVCPEEKCPMCNCIEENILPYQISVGVLSCCVILLIIWLIYVRHSSSTRYQ